MDFYLIQFLSGCANGMSLFMAAAGLSIVFGVTRIVNFAHGSLYMLGAFMAWSISQYLIQDPSTDLLRYIISIFLACLCVAAFAALIEITVLRRIYKMPELFQLLATFAVFLVIQDLALKIWGPEDRLGYRMPYVDGAIPFGGGMIPTYDLFLIGFGMALCAAMWLFFHRTRTGLLIRAATADRAMAAALGIKEKKLYTFVFALGGFLAALAGGLHLPRAPASLNMDMNILVEVFAVVVIGGMGSIMGAFWAALLVAQIQAFGILVFPESTLVLIFLVMAVVLVLRPQGLFAKPFDAPPDDRKQESPPLPRLSKRQIAIVLVALIGAAITPMLSGEYALVLGTEILLFILFAASLHFITLPGGMHSFGHAAYFGIAAYAAAWFGTELGWALEWNLLAAPLLAAIAALIFGFFCVRLKGIYMAMLTLACAQIVWSYVFQSQTFGGENGIIGLRRAAPFIEKSEFYYLSLTLVSISLIVLYRICFSEFGYALRATRDSSRRSESIGLDNKTVRLMAFVISGFFAGLSGALYGYAKGSVFPDYIAISKSIDVLVMLILGGVGNLLAPIVGVPVFVLIHDYLTRHLELWRLAMGLIVLALILFFPKGLSSIGRRGK